MNSKVVPEKALVAPFDGNCEWCLVFTQVDTDCLCAVCAATVREMEDRMRAETCDCDGYCAFCVVERREEHV